MQTKKFDPNQYRGKKVVYVRIPYLQGICFIFDWDFEKRRYVQRKCGNRYYAYKKAAGIQRSQCFELLEDAKRWKASDSLFAPKDEVKDRTFGEVKMLFLEHHKRRVRGSTFETCENNMRHLAFFEDLPMSQITSFAVDEWLRRIKKPEYLALQHRNRLTYEHEIKALRKVLVYYSEYIDDSYVLPIKKRHREDVIIDAVLYQQRKASRHKRYLTRVESDLFIGQLKKKSSMKPDCLIFEMIARAQLGTGLRVGEACALDFSDIDFNSGEIVVRRTVHWSRRVGRGSTVSPVTKTGEERIVLASSQLLEGLREWQRHCGRSVGLVFSNDGFAPVPYRRIQAQFNAAFRRAGLLWRSTHILRHTFATDFLERTGNQHALKALLGHRDVRMTEHYAKSTPESVREAFRVFEHGKDQGNVTYLAELRLGKAGNEEPDHNPICTTG